MKTTFNLCCAFATFLFSAMLVSCGPKTPLFLDTSAPEEATLNLVKITDESSTSVVSGILSSGTVNNFSNTTYGISASNNIYWSTLSALDISPDGEKIAYLSYMNNQYNIMVRSTKAGGTATQRTFRNVGSFAFGPDNKIYFQDRNRTKNGYNNYICSVNAISGSIMNQHTNGYVNDGNPRMSSDGKTLFFVRGSSSGASIWTIGEDGTLTLCAKGYNLTLIKDSNSSFYCVRNSLDGRSEIWFVDFVKGQESLVLADNNKSFTNPRLSPDGKWLVCVGNSVSSISQKHNLDIYVVKTDGTRLTQLTYHPQDDTCPVWSADGRYIYFISNRANEQSHNNIWRMNFNLN